jgi:hypothetical protein
MEKRLLGALVVMTAAVLLGFDMLGDSGCVRRRKRQTAQWVGWLPEI